MSEIKLKRSVTSFDPKLTFDDQYLPKAIYAEKEMTLKHYRNHFAAKKLFEVIPENNQYKDICLTPLVQPIVQPKSSQEEPQQSKKSVKNKNYIKIPKVGHLFHSASFIIEDGPKTLKKQGLSNEIKTKESTDSPRYYSSSQIGCFNQSVVLPIDLSESKASQLIERKQLAQYRLPFINTSYGDLTNKPSFINNYKQCGTNQNSFRSSSRNFPFHPPKVWLKTRYIPSSTSWIKQSDR